MSGSGCPARSERRRGCGVRTVRRLAVRPRLGRELRDVRGERRDLERRRRCGLELPLEREVSPRVASGCRLGVA